MNLKTCGILAFGEFPGISGAEEATSEDETSITDCGVLGVNPTIAPNPLHNASPSVSSSSKGITERSSASSSASNSSNSSNSSNNTAQVEVYGCTDSSAFNFDATATQNDGSCIDTVLGCTNTNARNYDSNANVDDGSCCTADVLSQLPEGSQEVTFRNPTKNYNWEYSEDCTSKTSESSCHSSFTKIDTTGNEFARCKWNTGNVKDWSVESGWNINRNSWTYKNPGSSQWNDVSNDKLENCSQYCKDALNSSTNDEVCKSQIISTRGRQPIYMFNGQKKTHGISIPSCNGCTGSNGTPNCSNVQGFCTVDFDNKYTDTSCAPLI